MIRTPHGKGQANARLQEIVEAELEIRRNDGEFAEDMALIQALATSAKRRHSQAIAPHQARITRLLPGIVQWYRLNLFREGTPGTREVKLDAGVIKGQLSSSCEVVITGDKDKVLDALAAIDPKYVTREPNLTAIAADRDKLRNVKRLGVSFNFKDTVRITSELLEGTAPPKKSRLNAVLKTFVNPRRKPEGLRAPARS